MSDTCDKCFCAKYVASREGRLGCRCGHPFSVHRFFIPEPPMTRCPKCTVNGQVNCPEHHPLASHDTSGDVGPADHLDGLVAYAIPTPSLLDFGKARALIPSHAQAALNAQAAALVEATKREGFQEGHEVGFRRGLKEARDDHR